jgi:hypothetical protein
MNFAVFSGARCFFYIFLESRFSGKKRAILGAFYYAVNEYIARSKNNVRCLALQSPTLEKQSRTLEKRSPMFGLTKFDFKICGTPWTIARRFLRSFWSQNF